MELTYADMRIEYDHMKTKLEQAEARLQELEAENLEQGVRWLEDVRKWISKIAKATSRADHAKALLRELADAAEWRDELRFIRSLISLYKVVGCLWGGREYEHFVKHLLTNEDAKFEFDNIMSASESDYQAALAAAKGSDGEELLSWLGGNVRPITVIQKKGSEMSIDMNKTDTLYEKIDVIGNLVEQMMLMNSIGDRQNFAEAHSKASKLCFEAARQMEDMGLDNQ